MNLRPYLVDRRQVIQNALQLVIFDSISNHYELLQKQEDVSADGQYILLSGARAI